MTKNEFQANAFALVGGGNGWQTRLAKHLNLNVRTIQRAVKDGPTDGLIRAMKQAMGESASNAIHAKWINGDGDDGQEYLIHTKEPRFICQVRDFGEESENDDGVKYASEDLILCEFQWQDSVPNDLAILLDQACDFLHGQSKGLEIAPETVTVGLDVGELN